MYERENSRTEMKTLYEKKENQAAKGRLIRTEKKKLHRKREKDTNEQEGKITEEYYD